MGKRKSIHKKIRFEVFKRDRFTCQYCGRMAPDVILEIDHILPVAKGGGNDIMNLITSCQDCNRGKGAKELSDDSVVKKQQKQIEELAIKNEQLKMLVNWRNGLSDIKEKEIDAVSDAFSRRTEWHPNESGRRDVRKWLSEFSLSEVLDAVDIAINNYYDGSSESWNYAFNKVSGICHNRKNFSGDALYHYNYLRKVCNSRFGFCTNGVIRGFVRKYVKTPGDFALVKELLWQSNTYYEFLSALKKEFCDGNL